VKKELSLKKEKTIKKMKPREEDNRYKY